MPKIKFLDSIKNKKKSLVFTHTEEDIVLNLPKESGTLVTDKLAEKKLNEANQGNQQNIIFILKPDITENNGGVTTSNWDEYFKIASYKTSAGFLGKHTGTEWVAYSDSNLTTLVDRSSGNILHKDKWKPNTNTPNLNLYVRYRFASNNIYSPWSDSIHVVTAPGGISPFDVSVEENTLTPLCTVSAFNAYGNASGANHVSTSWVVYEANGDNLGTKIIESLRDTTNKINFRIPNGKLAADREYYLQVTLHTDNSNYPNSKAYVRKFTTGSAYIERPVLKYEATDNSRHIIKASDFTCSDSSQSLVSAVWKLYNAENNTLINSVTNTSKEYDITIFVDSKKKYYVTLVYKSNELTSPEGKCTFTVKGSKADEITASFDTSTDPSTIKLPILKLSKFHIEGDTDEVKSMAYKSTHKDHSIEDQHGWFMGKYNVPMEHTLTRGEYRALLDLEKEWDNSPLKFKAYIIGNKYNSDMFEATFTSNISLNYKVVKYGESWDDFKIQIVKDDSLNPSNPTPGWIGFESVSIYGDKINTPINSGFHHHSEHTPIVAIPNNGYEYNKDYHFTFKIYNSVGVRTIEYTVKMEGDKIADPDMTIEAKHAYGDYVNMKVKGTEYSYSRPIDSTNGLKEIKLTIQDTSDNNKVVYETIQTVADKGPSVYNFDINYDKNHLDKSLKHNTKYLVSIEYKNIRGERSKRVTKEFTTLQRDEITVPEFEIQPMNFVASVDVNGTKHYIVADVRLRLVEYLYKQNTGAVKLVYKRIMDEHVENLNVTIKSLDGTVLLSHNVDQEALGKFPITRYPDIYARYSQGDFSFYYRDIINKEAKEGRIFINPTFPRVNDVYEITVTLSKEDKSVSRTIYLPIVADDRVTNLRADAHIIDNMPTRSELIQKTIIADPNLPAGTIVDYAKARELLKEHLGNVISPKTTVKSVSLFLNNEYTAFSIITDFDNPGNCKAEAKSLIRLENFVPDPRLNRRPSESNKVDKVYDYEKLKPIFFVSNESGKWFINIKYVLLPREIMNGTGFINPLFNSKTRPAQEYSNSFKRSNGVLDTKYEYTDPSGNKHILAYYPVYAQHVPTGPESTAIDFVTTKEYINREFGLSTVPSAGYKTYGMPQYSLYKDNDYGSEFLEYLPYDGAMFILLMNSNIVPTTSIKLHEDDNLICQKDPLAGINFKIYKINPDNTEILVPGIEDAFSAGVYLGVPNTYDILGKWTKPVNKRPVLEPGEKYRVKIWFALGNNFFYNDDYYIEKVFVAYKKENIPIPPTPPVTITKPEVSLNIHSKNGDGIVTGLSGAITNTINVTGKNWHYTC